ncbi:protein FAM200C-like [Palaemon carinicauda]|uniref:protein FAM200C-like n=1 Tax=Palaemon carinicauda TaxID=392227 RepID=UPI0035B64365
MHIDTVNEEILFCEHLLETTNAMNILELMNSFFAKQNIDCKKNLRTLRIDRAPAMLGGIFGFAALVQKGAPQVIVTHRFLHRHALASKILPPILKEIFSTGVKVVNFIWARTVNHCVFKRFCYEMGSQYKVLLYHAEVHWLFRR